MVAKKIFFDQDVQKRLGAGIDAIANAVKVTLGPGGRNVSMTKPFGPPTITKDGVSVAREVVFDDIRKIGADIAREGSIRTAEEAGDGTTSSMVLVQAMFNEASRLTAAGMHPIFLQRGMNIALKEALMFLQEYANPVETIEAIRKVATLAGNHDEQLGDMIAQAMEMVGKEGIISVEEGNSIDTTLEFSEGMQLDRGYEYPEYVLNEETGQVTYNNALVLLADKTLSQVQDLQAVLQYSVDQGRPLVIVSHGLEGMARQMVLSNVVQGVIKAISLKAPRIGDKRTDILQSLAIMTGGKVVGMAMGGQVDPNDIPDILGGIETVTVKKQTTTMIKGSGHPEEIQKRMTDLQSRAKRSGSEHDKEFYREQASRLGGGLAVIRVGASTELELKEFKARVEDALSATQSAIRSGIVPGGGCTFLEIEDYLSFLTSPDAGEDRMTFSTLEEEAGYNLVIKTLKEPFLRLVTNAGMESHEAFYRLKEAREAHPDQSLVFDARKEMIGDAMEEGIIDPALVIEQVLTNAVSIAGIAVTSACMIVSNDLEDLDEI